MQYYDKEGNLVEFNGTRTNLLGANGEIYKIDDKIAYKRYFSYAENRIKQAIFDFIRDLKNPHMVRLLDRYYLAEDIENFDIFSFYVNNPAIYDSPYNKDLQKVDLYTYEWVKKEYLDILEESVDYLLDNTNELLKLVDILSANGIKLADMRTDNLVCNKQGITLIDPDMYSFIPSLIAPDNFSFVPDDYDLNTLRIYNRKLVLMTLRILCASQTEYKGQALEQSISELFQDSIRNPKDGMVTLSKKLKGYQMPIEYLAKK